MKKIGIVIIIIISFVLFLSVFRKKPIVHSLASEQSWQNTKLDQVPENMLTSEFETPFHQPISTLGWEDGIYT